jgi:hypothetical protein
VWIDKLSLGNSPIDKAVVPIGPSRVVVYRSSIGSKVLKIDLQPGEHASYEVLMKDAPTPAPPVDPHPRATPEPDAEPAPSAAPTELGVDNKAPPKDSAPEMQERE